jgi:hypothetical protein
MAGLSPEAAAVATAAVAAPLALGVVTLGVLWGQALTVGVSAVAALVDRCTDEQRGPWLVSGTAARPAYPVSE